MQILQVSVAVALEGHAPLTGVRPLRTRRSGPASPACPVSRSQVEAEPGMVVECADSGFCGAVVGLRRPPKAEQCFWRIVMVCAAGFPLGAGPSWWRVVLPP